MNKVQLYAFPTHAADGGRDRHRSDGARARTDEKRGLGETTAVGISTGKRMKFASYIYVCGCMFLLLFLFLCIRGHY